MDAQDEALLRSLRMVLDVRSLSIRIAKGSQVINVTLSEEQKQKLLDAVSPPPSD